MLRLRRWPFSPTAHLPGAAACAVSSLVYLVGRRISLSGYVCLSHSLVTIHARRAAGLRSLSFRILIFIRFLMYLKIMSNEDYPPGGMYSRRVRVRVVKAAGAVAGQAESWLVS